MDQKLKDLDEILEKLSIKLKLINDIYDLTCEQNRKIKDNDIDGYIKIIDRRQIRMNKIDRHDKKLNNLIKNLELKYNISNIEDLNNDNIQLVNQLRNEIKNIAKQAYGIDIENNIIFKEKLKGMREKAVGVKKGKRLTSTYYPKQMQAQGHFIDKKR